MNVADLLSARSPRVPTAVLVAALAPAVWGQAVTVGSLADELGDRDTLTVFPTGTGSYKLLQSSSHDQRNGDPSITSPLGRPWGGLNADFSNWERFETNNGRTELVNFEHIGPGAITRWWTTALNGGLLDNNIRIYLADSQGNFSQTPDVTTTANNFVGRNGQGNTLGFGDNFSFITPNVGGNSYGPITYQHGVKVTWDGPSNHRRDGVDYPSLLAQHQATGSGSFDQFRNTSTWYNINYRAYGPGTVVEDFAPGTTTTYAGQLATANTRLTNNVVNGHIGATDTLNNQAIGNGASLTRNYTAPPGAENGQAIREITLKFNGGTGAQQAAALAGTFVELTFDGQRTARVPAGQFFGNGWSENNSNAYNDGDDYFRSVAANGTMTSRWVMPYQNDAQVRLVNESGQAVNVDLAVKAGDYDWTNDSLHFHADYREELGIETRAITVGGNFDGAGILDADFRFIDIRGRGVYVGDTLSVRNRDIGGGGNPDGWWGEGDEKVYVDYLDANGNGAAATPVHVGTGAEDYYGYSFGSGANFQTPFVSQPIATGQRNNPNGLTVNGRVRGLDAITFEQSLKFDLEVWKWREGEVDHGAATFWYGAPGSASMHVAAEMATDFKRHIAGGISNGATSDNIADTAGDGTWTFFNADTRTNPTDTQLLTWGGVGNAGNQGFGGGENGFNPGNDAFNLGAVSDQYLFLDGGDNLGAQGPSFRELALHASGNDLGGTAEREFLVSRWTAGASSVGLINVHGSVRNLVDNGGDSIDFYIYVNGVEFFSVNATGTILPEAFFDFDTTIAEGQFIDFVLGNGPASGGGADEALIRATILSLGDTFNTVTQVVAFAHEDLDQDGDVDDADFALFFAAFSGPGVPTGNRAADLDGDNDTDDADFGLAFAAFTGPGGAANVPEPAGLVLMSLGGLLAARRRRAWSMC